jgi:hypothetical protein
VSTNLDSQSAEGSTTIVYTITFSEAILASSFTAADLTLGGTATQTGWTKSIGAATNNGRTFEITVSRSSAVNGTLTLTIASGAVTDLAGNATTANTNTVTRTFVVLPELAVGAVKLVAFTSQVLAHAHSVNDCKN